MQHFSVLFPGLFPGFTLAAIEFHWIALDEKLRSSNEKGRLLDISKRPWTLWWWSWGDLNPRPQALFGQIYMFSGLI
jgi:hypothetical protein